MKRILIISFTNLKNDPRVFRQISTLNQASYQITALGIGSPELENVEFLQVGRKEKFIHKAILAFSLFFRAFEWFYWQQRIIKESKEKLAQKQFDLIIANDIEALPLATFVKEQNPTAKLILDAHEYAPLEHEDKLIWKLLFQKQVIHILNSYKSKVDKMFTVCQGIAQEYQKQFGLSADVITNASEYFEIEPKPVLIDRIKLIHHGGSIPARKIENMIWMMDELGENYQLDLMLVNCNASYHKKLESLCLKRNNVQMIPTVSMKEIIPFISKYDIGVYLLEPSNFNNKMALPNKFFEFIQARLMLAFGPSVEMTNYIFTNQIGVISEDFSGKAMAKEIKKYTPSQIFEFKKNSQLLAQKLNANENKNRLLAVVKELLWE